MNRVFVFVNDILWVVWFSRCILSLFLSRVMWWFVMFIDMLSRLVVLMKLLVCVILMKVCIVWNLFILKGFKYLNYMVVMMFFFVRF